MLKIKKSIHSWYAINLVEGEGIGTAYEYCAKFRKLARFLNSIEKPKNILIAGLPEKYGLSMDFFWLAQILKAETVVVDERPEVLDRAQRVLSKLEEKQILDAKTVVFEEIESLRSFKVESIIKGKFDLALSSEVYQRLDGGQQIYLNNLRANAKNLAVFAPNRGNSSHAELSGLKSVYLTDLIKHFSECTSMTIYDRGYLDMPPFPPGLSRSQEKRQQASENRLERFLMKILEFYCYFENSIPVFLKKRIAHITYFMAKGI
jgi:hypothetical protein